MALIEKVVLASAKALTATTNGDAVSIDPLKKAPYFLFANASAVGAGTSLVIKLQHSPDNGTTWIDVASGALSAITGVGTQSLMITGEMLGLIRPVYTFTGGTTTATVSVSLHGGIW